MNIKEMHELSKLAGHMNNEIGSLVNQSHKHIELLGAIATAAQSPLSAEQKLEKINNILQHFDADDLK